MASKNPSIKKSNPIAVIRSLMFEISFFLIRPDFPKNLKKSLSGESIRDVSPPIRAFS